MKKRVHFFMSFCILIALFSSACRTEFERIRQSNDPNVIYEQAVKFYEQEEYLKAQSLLELILNSFRGTEKAEDLYFKYAYTHYYLKSYVNGAYYFDNFSSTFINSDLREEADFMKAYCSYLLSPSFRLDQEFTRDAINQFQLFINQYPNSERVVLCNDLIDECRLKLEEKMYDQARLYYDLKNYKAAIHTFENVLKEFPDTDKAESIRYTIVKANYEYAANSFLDKQKERYQGTIKAYNEFIKKYPESEYLLELDNLYATSDNAVKTFYND